MQSSKDGGAAKETFILEYEDGPPIGVLIEKPDGGEVWSGSISKSLWSAQSEDERHLLGGDDRGLFVVSAEKGDRGRVICRVASADDGIAIARALAPSHGGE